MDIIGYLILVLLIWISTGLGGVLARLAVEELKIGKKYFLFAQKILFFFIIAIPLYLVFGLFAVLIAAVIWFVLWIKNKKAITPIAFGVFGVWFYTSTQLNAIYILTLLLILYGYIDGTLMFMTKKLPKRIPEHFLDALPLVTKTFFNVTKQYWLFPVLAIITYVVLVIV